MLEDLLTKYQGLTGAVVAELEKHTLQIAKSYLHLGLSHYDGRKLRGQFEKQLQPWFDIAAGETVALVTRLRRSTYALTYLGATEGIARATGSAEPVHLTSQLLDRVSSKDAPSGGPLRHRVDLAFARLLRDVLDAFQLSQVMSVTGEDGSPDRTPQAAADLLARISRAFPRRVKNVKKRAQMAKLKEASGFGIPGRFDGSGPDGIMVSTGTIEPEEWKQILEDYFSEHFPLDSPNRTPYSRVYYSEEPTDEGRYEWELESEVSEDFIRSVRSGDNDAANAQGIDDFQWVSIIDGKTDECCVWRDGLTTSEIEAQLEGDHADDSCDAITSPAHPYCRCRMVPMVAELKEVEHSNLPSFDEWLSSEAVQAA